MAINKIGVVYLLALFRTVVLVTDVTTLYRKVGINKSTAVAECHARTDALGYAFIAPNGSSVDPIANVNVPSCRHNFKMSCPWMFNSWKSIDDKQKYSLFPKPHVPSEIGILRTDGSSLSEVVPLSHTNFRFSLRTSVVGVARVLLMQERDVRTSNLYAFDIVHNNLYAAHQTSSALKCGHGHRYQDTITLVPDMTPRRCNPLGNSYVHWNDNLQLMFRLKATEGSLQLWREDDETLLINHFDEDYFKVKYLAVVTNGIERIWTFYLDAKFWLLKGFTGYIRSPAIFPKSNKVCISFHAFMKSINNANIKVMAKFGNGTRKLISVIKSSQWKPKTMEWKLQRLILHLGDNMNNSLSDSGIQITLEGRKTIMEDQIAVHSIMGCNTEEEEDIVMMETPIKKRPYICRMRILDTASKFPKNCPKCLHGGLCHKETGICICPPGFVGSRCEEGCGANRFGHDCGGKCSRNIDGCRGIILCANVVGCHCAPGYTGEDCELGCTNGLYGVNCFDHCGRCLNDTSCNPYSGSCHEGCVDGFYPPLCQTTYSYLLQPPNVTNNVGTTTVQGFFSVHPLHLLGEGIPMYYQVQYMHSNESQWQQEIPVLLPQKQYIPVMFSVTGLKADTNYKLRILLIDRDGSTYNDESAVPYVVFTSRCDVPTHPLYKLKASWKEKYQLEIEWEYEANLSTACELSKFRVYLWEGWRQFLYTTTNETHISVSDHSPYFSYSVQVQAITTHGDVPISNITEVLSEERGEVPSQVLDLKFKQISSEEIEVYWQHPRRVVGENLNYSVVYRCLRLMACGKHVSCGNFSGNLTTAARNLRLTELLPHAQYEIKVAAFLGDMGPFTRITATTLPQKPQVAPAVSGSGILKRTADSFIVSWLPPKNCKLLHGFPIGYQYTLYIIEDDGYEKIVKTGNVTQTRIGFANLQLNQDYIIEVLQVVSGGFTNPLYPLRIIIKKFDNKLPSNWQLALTNVTATATDDLYWKYPECNRKKGLLHFITFFTCKHIMNCSQYHSCTAYSTVITNTSSTHLSDLKFDAIYTMQVTTVMEENGTYTDISVITPLTESEQLLKASGTTRVLTWIPPDECSLLNGHIIGYIYEVLQLNSKNDSLQTSLIFQNMTNGANNMTTNLTNIPFYTKYMIKIYTISDYRNGILMAKKFLNSTVCTQTTVPSAVSSLVVYRKGHDRLGLRWKVPYYDHGPIDSASLRFTDLKSRGGDIKIKLHPCSVWKDHVCHDVTGLLPNNTYTVVVRVWNSNVLEEGMPAEITGITKEGESEIPTFLHMLNKTDTSFSIEWGYPNLTNGILRGFHIVAKQIASYHPDLCCENTIEITFSVIEDKSTYALEVKPLRPSSKYYISVAAKTNVIGPAIGFINFTLPGKPKLNKAPRIIPGTLTDFSVNVTLHAANSFLNGPISAYFLVVNTEIVSEGLYYLLSESIQSEMEQIIGQGYVAMELHEIELEESLNVTVGNGEDILGIFGSFYNQPLESNTSYSLQLVIMSEYNDFRSYGYIRSDNFTTFPTNTTREDPN